MKTIEKTPIWVSLAYANIHTRIVALWLIISCVVFTIYCVPWAQFSKNQWVEKLFLIDDWSWFAIMLPMTIWYWISFKWVDKNQGWF